MDSSDIAAFVVVIVASADAVSAIDVVAVLACCSLET